MCVCVCFHKSIPAFVGTLFEKKKTNIRIDLDLGSIAESVEMDDYRKEFSNKSENSDKSEKNLNNNDSKMMREEGQTDKNDNLNNESNESNESNENKKKSNDSEYETEFKIPFWALMTVDNDMASTVMYLSTEQMDEYEIPDISKKIRTALKQLQDDVNQQVLLQTLYETKQINSWLIIPKQLNEELPSVLSKTSMSSTQQGDTVTQSNNNNASNQINHQSSNQNSNNNNNNNNNHKNMENENNNNHKKKKQQYPSKMICGYSEVASLYEGNDVDLTKHRTVDMFQAGQFECDVQGIIVLNIHPRVRPNTAAAQLAGTPPLTAFACNHRNLYVLKSSQNQQIFYFYQFCIFICACACACVCVCVCILLCF